MRGGRGDYHQIDEEKNGAADIKEEEKETTKADKHQKVMGAVNEGLMQVHGSAPNSK